MTRLENLKEGTSVKSVRPDGPVTVVNVKWLWDALVELTYKDASGKPINIQG